MILNINLHRVFIMGMLLFVISGCAEKENVKPINDNSAAFCLNDFMKDDIVKVAVNKTPITESISLNARVEANPDKLVQFVSLVSGVVTKTYFSLGEEVKKGQLLLEMTSSELSNLNAQFQSLKSQIEVAQRNLQSVQEMHQDKIASQRDLIEAQSNLAVLQPN